MHPAFPCLSRHNGRSKSSKGGSEGDRCQRLLRIATRAAASAGTRRKHHPASRSTQVSYKDEISNVERLISSKSGTWAGIDPESVTRMRLQNRFHRRASISRAIPPGSCAPTWPPMMPTLSQVHAVAWLLARLHRPAEADRDQEAFRHDQGPLSCICRAGWSRRCAAEFGPLPDQSMHEKTSVPALVAELYTFLKPGRCARDWAACSGRSRQGARKAGNAVEAQTYPRMRSSPL